jgi:hypothetical protein
MCRATQDGCDGSQPCCTLIALLRSRHDGDAFQAPSGIGGIAQPLVDRQALPVTPFCSLVVLLLASKVPQQREDVGDAPGHIKGARRGEGFFQQRSGTYDIPALACQLAEIEQSKAYCASISRILCPLRRGVTFCVVGAGLGKGRRGQRYGTERGKHVGDFEVVSRLLCQCQCLSG